MTAETLKGHAMRLFNAACASVNPRTLVRSHLKVVQHDNSSRLVVNDAQKYVIDTNVYVLAFGKAALAMSVEVANILGRHMVRAIASVPKGALNTCQGQKLPDRLEVYEGAANNLSDAEAEQTAIRAKKMLKALGPNDVVIVLVSGGGSALLPSPVENVTLSDKQHVVIGLSKKGASIYELNTVRQHLSTLKGGGLPNFAKHSSIISLIFSDIMSNDLQFVASGPTVSTTTCASDAVCTIKRYLNWNDVPKSVRCYFEAINPNNSKQISHPERVLNILIGDNTKALRAAKAEAKLLKYTCHILGRALNGDACAIGSNFASLLCQLVNKTPVEALYKSHDRLFDDCTRHQLEEITSQLKSGQFVCLLWGGETTVNVKGSGLGGRNQELTLSFLVQCLKQDELLTKVDESSVDFLLASLGTDGQDGPTDAAGALVHSSHLRNVSAIVAQQHLSQNDSYHFFQKHLDGRCLIKTGLTSTNVMDIVMLFLRILA